MHLKHVGRWLRDEVILSFAFHDSFPSPFRIFSDLDIGFANIS